MFSIVLPAVVMLSGLLSTGMDHGSFDKLLGQYVRDGLVDYGALKANREPLDAYLDGAGAVTSGEFQAWPRNDRLAFLINLYNAATLRLIIDAYPVDSIKSLGSLLSSPWDKKVVGLFGDTISLDRLEHEIIRKDFEEPRIHFALVCAALGCPPLRGEAYRGAALEAQLEEQTRSFLQTREKNYLDREKQVLWLSPIFKWYRADFEVGGKSLVDFVTPYLNAGEGAATLADVDVSFTHYDWRLNDLTTKSP